MEKTEKHKLITELIDSSERIALLPSSIAGIDAFCAGAGLYHILKQKEKKVSLIYPWKLPDKTEHLVEAEDIVTDASHKELVVYIDYSQTGADKVQYSTENGVLALKISPVTKNFDQMRYVTSEIKGNSHDLFIVIGAQGLDDFGHLYEEMQKEISLGKVINLDITDRNTRFGHFNVIEPLTDSLSQMVIDMASNWNLKVPKDAAKALLTGITHKVGH